MTSSILHILERYAGFSSSSDECDSQRVRSDSPAPSSSARLASRRTMRHAAGCPIVEAGVGQELQQVEQVGRDVRAAEARGCLHAVGGLLTEAPRPWP